MDKFRFIENILIKNLIDKYKLDNIINHILCECKFTVIGYEKFQDKYWCKRINNSKCELHFEIQVLNIDSSSSAVKIMPLVGTNDGIQNFINDFREYIQLYQSSNFVKHYLDNYCI